jgi:cysteinyl-tRNA synthetase
MANFWMHNGFLQVEGEKMSKSLGNFVTIRELLQTNTGNAARLAMLMTHYRQPINWTGHKLDEAHHELRRWSKWHAGRFSSSVLLDNRPNGTIELLPPSGDLIAALSDDLNTPQAIHHLRQLYQRIEDGDLSQIDQHYSDAHFLGLAGPQLSQRYAYFGQAGGSATPAVLAFATPTVDRLRVRLINSLPNDDIVAEINNIGLEVCLDDRGYFSLAERPDLSGTTLEKIRRLVEERSQARKTKDWAKADRIRDELAKVGIAPKDNSDGTATWTVLS